MRSTIKIKCRNFLIIFVLPSFGMSFNLPDINSCKENLKRSRKKLKKISFYLMSIFSKSIVKVEIKTSIFLN